VEKLLAVFTARTVQSPILSKVFLIVLTNVRIACIYVGDYLSRGKKIELFVRSIVGGIIGGAIGGLPLAAAGSIVFSSDVEGDMEINAELSNNIDRLVRKRKGSFAWPLELIEKVEVLCEDDICYLIFVGLKKYRFILSGDVGKIENVLARIFGDRFVKTVCRSKWEYSFLGFISFIVALTALSLLAPFTSINLAYATVFVVFTAIGVWLIFKGRKKCFQASIR